MAAEPLTCVSYGKLWQQSLSSTSIISVDPELTTLSLSLLLCFSLSLASLSVCVRVCVCLRGATRNLGSHEKKKKDFGPLHFNIANRDKIIQHCYMDNILLRYRDFFNLGKVVLLKPCFTFQYSE